MSEKIDISRLSAECAFIVQELGKELGFTIGEGIVLEAERSFKSFAERAGKRLFFGYRDLNEFGRLLLAASVKTENNYRFSLGKGFERTGFMADNSRNAVLHLSALKKLIRKSALLGLNRLYLYMEDTYEVEGQPYFGYFRGRFSVGELREADAYAAKFGITLVPCIQVLAHLNQIFRWTPYLEINDCEDILLADDERTYSLIEDMFRSLRSAVSGAEINIGMDEAYLAGLGKHLIKFGFQDRTEMLSRHVRKVADIAERYGFRCAMWSDMYFRLVYGGEYYAVKDSSADTDALAKVPENVELIYWDYYSSDESRFDTMMKKHNRLGDHIQFAGGAWKWTGFLPDNEFAIQITEPAVRMAKKNGIRTFFLTGWGDNGGECSVFAILPALFYFSRLNFGLPTEGEEFEREFTALAGMPYKEFLKLELPNRAAGTGGVRKPNISKYYLYNDYFMGVMDSVLSEGEAQRFAQIAKELDKAKGEFAYLFDSAKLLSEVLSLKCYLGVKTRRAYKSGDKEELLKLSEVYTRVHEKLKEFYESFRAQWLKENKPHGFDVQDIRLGGLMMRTKDCRRRILEYCRGETDRIEELEEDVLPFMGNNECKDGDIVLYSNYALIATQNAL